MKLEIHSRGTDRIEYKLTQINFHNETKNIETTNQINIEEHFEGLVQDCSISSALALEILQSCTEPSDFVVKMFMKMFI